MDDDNKLTAEQHIDEFERVLTQWYGWNEKPEYKLLHTEWKKLKIKLNRRLSYLNHAIGNINEDETNM